MSSAYSDVASFGRGYAFFSAIIATIICLALIGGGIYLLILAKKDSSVQATVVSINGKSSTDTSEACQASMTNRGVVTSYDCPNIIVSYVVNGKSYTSAATTISSPMSTISVGDKVYVEYVKANPSQISYVSVKPMSFSTIGWVLIGVGAVFLLFSWINVWLARRFKIVGAVDGVEGAGRLLRVL